MHEVFLKYPGGAIAHQYISDVLDGTIVACEFVKLACKRHINDLEHGHERGLWFDPDAGQRVLDFKQRLKHSKGKWRGKRLILEPWQVFINWVLFGWKNEDGTRRFRKMYQEVARKNGKSTEVASSGLFLMGFDGEGGSEVYSVANKEEQAKLVWSEGQRMCKQAKDFGGRLKRAAKSTFRESTDSFWKPLGKDSKTQDGLNPHGVLVDEYHAAPDSTMLDVMDSALGSREQPLLIIITTAGFNSHGVCHEERDYAVEVLRGTIEDDTYFAIVFTLDKSDDRFDKDLWIKSNPNLGISVNIKDMENMARQAQKMPSKLNNFLTKKLNIWTSQKTMFFDMELWNACDGTFNEKDLIGRPCFLAGDLASKNDIAALSAVFKLDNDKLAVLSKFYCPKERILRRQRTDKVTYEAWVQKGYLNATEGNRIDYEFIKADILSFFKKFDVVKMGFDAWNFEYLLQRLIADGVDKDKVFEFPQTLKTMSEPTKELEVLVAEKRIVHNNNPILSWMAGNTAIYTDPNENIRPVKNKSSEKIDGIVSLVMALGMEMGEQDDNDSIYETQDIIVI